MRTVTLTLTDAEESALKRTNHDLESHVRSWLDSILEAAFNLDVADKLKDVQAAVSNGSVTTQQVLDAMDGLAASPK